MISWRGKEAAEFYWQNKAITAIYAFGKEVWTLFLSCFGRGYWIDELPWTNNDIWEN